MSRTLCQDDLSDKSVPHPTRHTPSHLPPEGKAYIIQNTKCFPLLFILQSSVFSLQSFTRSRGKVTSDPTVHISDADRGRRRPLKRPSLTVTQPLFFP